MFQIVTIFLVAALGGSLPLLFKPTDRLLHGALSFSSGVFLGAVFLHLFPELAGIAEGGHGKPPIFDPTGRLDPDAAGGGHVHGDPFLWFWVLIGVLAVYLVESLLLGNHAECHGTTEHGDHADQHHHNTVGWAALIGLSLHALTAGVALAGATDGSSRAQSLFIGLVAHKGFESFSLTSVFRLAGASRTRIVVLVLLFSAVTPLGVLLGGTIKAGIGGRGDGIMMALAAGTFLYVCLCELLPEVFHRREDIFAKLVLLASGIGSIHLAQELGG